MLMSEARTKPKKLPRNEMSTGTLPRSGTSTVVERTKNEGTFWIETESTRPSRTTTFAETSPDGVSNFAVLTGPSMPMIPYWQATVTTAMAVDTLMSAQCPAVSVVRNRRSAPGLTGSVTMAAVWSLCPRGARHSASRS